MTAPHFFVSAEQSAEPGGQVLLSPEDSRHALRSLRLRSGEAVTIADGSGLWATGAVTGERDGRAVIQVQDTRQVAWPEPSLTVAMAPPKGDRLAWAVQKLAEIGVERLEIIDTERTVRAWPRDRADRAVNRLRAVAREAAMQSRRPFLMEVEVHPLSPDRGDRTGAELVLWEEANRGLSDLLPATPVRVRLVVGPEGGFTEQEVAEAEARGAVPASLGPAILRTETAAVVGAALVLARYGRLG